MSKLAGHTLAPDQHRQHAALVEVQVKPSNHQPIKVWISANGQLRCTVGDSQTHLDVRPVWVAPLSHPNRFLSLMNAKNEEVALIENPRELDEESREAIESEISRRYLTATVLKVIKATVEFGATYWNVETDRGRRDFVTQNLQENAQWLSSKHLLLIDVDGNRFEIPDVTALDMQSVRIIGTIV